MAQVVIAAISPLAKDLAHSANTLGYAAPLRVAAAAPMSIERDPRDPANWSNQEIVEWVAEQTVRVDIIGHARIKYQSCMV